MQSSLGARSAALYLAALCGSFAPYGALPVKGSLSIDGALGDWGSLTLRGTLSTRGSLELRWYAQQLGLAPDLWGSQCP